MVTKKLQPSILRHESTDSSVIDSDKKLIKHLKDEVREYKRQIKVLRKTIEKLKSVKNSR